MAIKNAGSRILDNILNSIQYPKAGVLVSSGAVAVTSFAI